jgi:hypothetical protein
MIVKASITNLNNGEVFWVMFNPEEYSLDEGSAFAEIGIPGLRTPPIQYVRGNARSLKMELFYDTYESGGDVRRQTRQITALLDKDPATQAPPILLFSWGGLNFKCVLESVGQRFIFFLRDGTPVRAKLSVSFKEYTPVEIDFRRGFFIGPPSLHNVAARITGERDTLSQIAAATLGDPGRWREIAEANDIDNPRLIPPGLPLIVPLRGSKNPGGTRS